jgi:hypothetical protein
MVPAARSESRPGSPIRRQGDRSAHGLVGDRKAIGRERDAPLPRRELQVPREARSVLEEIQDEIGAPAQREPLGHLLQGQQLEREPLHLAREARPLAEPAGAVDRADVARRQEAQRRLEAQPRGRDGRPHAELRDREAAPSGERELQVAQAQHRTAAPHGRAEASDADLGAGRAPELALEQRPVAVPREEHEAEERRERGARESEADSTREARAGH